MNFWAGGDTVLQRLTLRALPSCGSNVTAADLNPPSEASACMSKPCFSTMGSTRTRRHILIALDACTWKRLKIICHAMNTTTYLYSITLTSWKFILQLVHEHCADYGQTGKHYHDLVAIVVMRGVVGWEEGHCVAKSADSNLWQRSGGAYVV